MIDECGVEVACVKLCGLLATSLTFFYATQ